jgi:phosphatidylglycerophosphatase A
VLFGTSLVFGFWHLGFREVLKALDPLVLWLASGFGTGRIPWAPGTFGSIIGLLWFAILLSTQYLTLFVLGIIAGLSASVVICGRAERILRQRDPGSIVLDEIAAIPICFLAWVASDFFRQGRWPPLETFFGPKTWYLTLILFAAFRLFDISKPWPVRQSQRLPGGWGVVTDDVLAAVYVCALSLIVFH